MTASTKTQAPAIVGHRDAQAGALILKAGKAAVSMLTACKEAASIAAKQLNPAQPMAERVSAVVSLYAADFATAGHNVKSLFVDALVLIACGQTPVTVTITGKDGKKVETHTTAAEAAALPKHAMKDAAKQARDANGMGRKAGGGAKPKAKPVAKTPAGQPAPDMAVTASEVDGFTAWLDNLDAYLSDVIFHQKIVARMIELGYSVNKAAPGRKVKGSASV